MMKLYCSSKRMVIFWLLIFLTGIVPLSFAQSTGTNRSAERYVSIDFNDVDITVFIKFISELTGKNFVIDNRVKGKVTIISPSKISVDEAYKVFESVLEVHGYATVKAGEVTKIIASPEARTKNIETLLREEARSPDDRVITQLIPLRYADPADIKRLFAPLISKSSVILDYQPTNTLIITDVYSNILRLLKILKTIDVPGVGQEISVIPLEYADAEKMVRVLTTIFQQQKRRPKGAAADDIIKFVADERTNTLVMVASEDDTIKIKELISRLDKEVPRGKGNIHVYYLENAQAEELAKVLQSLSAKPKPATVKGKKEAPIVSEATNISFDKATNSLIIMAEKDDYQVLEEVIKKLDIRRAMVFIECLIMEVNVDKGFNLGTEWIAGGKTDYDGKTGYFGTGFSGLGGENGYEYVTPSSASSLINPLPRGLSLGIFGEYIDVGGLLFPNISALVQAYKKDKNVYILSTPQILTTDNEEASITVGKNVPYQTRQGVSTTTVDDTSYNTYEYKDVAITLKITPQISKDRLIRLKISQEVSKLDQTSAGASDRPTTLKRTIDTTVIVNDKNTIVIGGLIDDSFSNTEYKIPCLGDVPGLGWFFKSMSRGREKTNLFVFLTPHVLETADEAEKFYQKKKDQIDAVSQDEDGIKLYRRGQEWNLEENLTPEEKIKIEQLKEELKIEK